MTKLSNVVLIGLAGSGKSSLGAALAKRLGMSFIDTDLDVEQQANMTIVELFQLHGESHFRDLETAAVKRASGCRNTVIATGGGSVLRDENIQALREHGLIVFIDRPVSIIATSIEPDGRPLLAKGTASLLQQSNTRRPLYQAAADVTLINEGNWWDALEALVGAVGDTNVAATEDESATVDKRGVIANGQTVANRATAVTRRQNTAKSQDVKRIFAVIGDPIAHSLSPVIHNTVFTALGLPYSYQALHVPKGSVGQFLEQVRDGAMPGQAAQGELAAATGPGFPDGAGLSGLNVTIPHKKAILPFLDAVAEEAKLAGAVNTVVIRNGRLYGHNTDMLGLAAALADQGFSFSGSRVVLIGTGGAAAAIALKAAQDQAISVTVLGRNATSTRNLVAALQQVTSATVTSGGLTPAGMAQAASTADILINATPLGMSGFQDDFVSLQFLKAIPPGGLVCDIVYQPPLTKLLSEAAALGLKTQNGLAMLIYQALLADELFIGRELDKKTLYGTVNEALLHHMKGEKKNDHHL
ncbi:MAG: hypothetical protein FWF71_06295 [Actinomycetia bacterium]|nr:hypothetical protein [Actinomycetes bacterium]